MAIIAQFELLSRTACKASIMLEGLTGTGKSGLAIMLGYGLEGGFREGVSEEERAEIWKKIFAIDTENQSLRLFIGIPANFGGTFGQFYGHSLTTDDGYLPSNYLLLRDAAVQAGAGTVIKDSITHMWTAKGGLLDTINQIKNENPRMDNYRVWGTPVVMEEKQRLIDTVRDNRCHVITTVRVKEKFEMRYNEARKSNDVISLGEQQLQQEGLKYEPDLVLHMIEPGSATDETPRYARVKVVKSRYTIFNQGEEYLITPEICEQLRQYLSEGVDPAVLLEKQRLDYVEAITEILDSQPSAKTIWPVLKEDLGLKAAKLKEISLAHLKHLHSQLTN